MAKNERKAADCRLFPSEKKCSVTIAGTEDEVLEIAVQHAVTTPATRRRRSSAKRFARCCGRKPDAAAVFIRPTPVDILMREPYTFVRGTNYSGNR